jgi:hypothetical protein
VGALGWIDHFDRYGPITDPAVLEEPKYLTSAVILGQSEEGLERAIRGWSKFGRLEVVEAVYAYIVQARRGVLGVRELARKLLAVLQRAGEGDVLALQRVLKLGLGITTCDVGLVVLAYTRVAGSPEPERPATMLLEIRGEESAVYIARNNSGPAVYDLETMCVVPMSAREPLHPLYRAYLMGYRIATDRLPSRGDLCVVHKRLRRRVECALLEA